MDAACPTAPGGLVTETQKDALAALVRWAKTDQKDGCERRWHPAGVVPGNRLTYEKLEGLGLIEQRDRSKHHFGFMEMRATDRALA